MYSIELKNFAHESIIWNIIDIFQIDWKSKQQFYFNLHNWNPLIIQNLKTFLHWYAPVRLKVNYNVMEMT